MKNIKVAKLFITHPHSDHINGIEELTIRGVFDNSEVWLNAFYSWPTIEYNNLLRKLIDPKRNISFVNPISINNGSINGNVEIWHPNNILIRKKYRYHPISYQEEKSANNSSSVYLMKFINKSILYPGDIEKKGWNRISNMRICSPSMKSVNYYCLSHHGSNNGHRRICSKRNINTVSDCFNCAPEIVFVMGRNRAYNNIFNSSVLNDFRNICLRQYTTDPRFERQNNRSKRNFNFIELDWSTNNVNVL